MTMEDVHTVFLLALLTSDNKSIASGGDGDDISVKDYVQRSPEPVLP